MYDIFLMQDFLEIEDFQENFIDDLEIDTTTETTTTETTTTLNYQDLTTLTMTADDYYYVKSYMIINTASNLLFILVVALSLIIKIFNICFKDV